MCLIQKSVLVPTLLSVVVFVCLSEMGETLSAQPLMVNLTSVEWLAGDSQHVAIGTIVKYEKIPDSRFHEVTVRLSKTLKGEQLKEITFMHEHGFGHYNVDELIQNKQSIVFFFKYWVEARDYNAGRRERHFSRHKFCLFEFISLEPLKVRVGSQSIAPVVKSDLTHLNSSREIVETIEAYLDKRGPDWLLSPIRTNLPENYNFGGILGQLLAPADAPLQNEIVEDPSAEVIKNFNAFKKENGTERPSNVLQYGGQVLKGEKHFAQVDSIELMFSDCDVVLSATIKDFCYLSKLHKDLGQYGSYAVELQVDEVYKGEANSTATVYLPYQVDIEPVFESGQSMLFFLRQTSKTRIPFYERHSAPQSIEIYPREIQQFDFSVRSDCWDNSIIKLDPEKAQVLFGDLTWHNRPKEILERVRLLNSKEWNAVPIGSPWMVFKKADPLPLSLATGKWLTSDSWVANSINVNFRIPVDHHLENNAKQWIKSPDKDRRLTGVRAMLYFRSDENIDLLNSVLLDDAKWDWHFAVHWTSGEEKKHVPSHLIRWEAWKTLSAWGVDCEKPDFGKVVFEKE